MQVELPDGSKREVPDGATVADVAASIGRRLAKDAVAGRVNGKVVDLSVDFARDGVLRQPPADGGGDVGDGGAVGKFSFGSVR